VPPGMALFINPSSRNQVRIWILIKRAALDGVQKQQLLEVESF